MRSSRHVPDTFSFSCNNAGFDLLLHLLVDIFPRVDYGEKVDSVKGRASNGLRAYLDGIAPEDALVTAYRMMNFRRTWCWSEEWRKAICSSMGFTVFDGWLEDHFQREFSALLAKHKLVLLLIEDRGPHRRARYDLELGGVVESPTHGRIAYIHFKGRHQGSVFPGYDVIVPLTPPPKARLIRTEKSGTKVYEIDLSLPRID